MNSTIQRLSTLQVSDAMTPRVVTISANSTMAEAADLLSEKQITGAPVVDEKGHCIGVISGTDFIHSKAEELVRHDTVPDFLASQLPSGTYSIEHVQHDLVRHHMSPAVQTVGHSDPLLSAAKMMCQQHVHRLIVLDESGAPVGILTSLDLVATLVSSVEE